MTRTSIATIAAGGLCGAIGLSCGAATEPHPSRPAAVLAQSPRQPAPPTIRSSRVIGLTLADFVTCALSNAGRVRCWGWDVNGELGHAERKDVGDDELPSSDADVPIGQPATDVASGGSHACAVTQAGNISCWGLWKPVVHPPGWARTVDLLKLGSRKAGRPWLWQAGRDR